MIKRFLILFLWRSALVVIPLLILIDAAGQHFVLSGMLRVRQEAGEKSAYFSAFLPEDRASQAKKDDRNNFYREIFAEPIYIDLNLSRSFNELDLEMDYQNDNVPLVSLGLQAGPENQFDLQAVENKNVDFLLNDKANWAIIQEDDVFLIQRKTLVKKFQSLKDFVANLPASGRLAVYNYDLKPAFRLKNYFPSNKDLIIDRSFRGSHQILTYLKNEPLEFTLKIQDINRHDGPDPLEVVIYKNYEPIHSQRLEDDGLDTRFGPASAQRLVNVSLPNLDEGVYRIELRTNDDIFFREVRTRQSKWVFLNRLYLTDNVQYHDGFPQLRTDPVAVFTNGHVLSAYTSHKDGLQRIQIENQSLDINQTHQKFNYKPSLSFKPAEQGVYRLVSPKNDILLQANGVFALSKDQFFNPNFIALDVNFNDWSGVDYVLARYHRPNYFEPPFPDGLKTVKAHFDLNKAFKTDGKVRLIISAPEVSKQTPLKIYQIRANLRGKEINLDEIKFW